MSGYFDPKNPPPSPLPDGYAPVIIYGYTPSFAVAIAAVVLFAISFVLHSYQLFRYRTWYFSTMPIALLFEIVGYVSRALSSRSPYFVLYFVLQYFFIVTAPVFISAAIYTILSVLIKRVGTQYSPFLSPKSILAIFITSDVICTGVQICGAALIGAAKSNDESGEKGNNILLAGLAVQVFVFFVFLVLLFTFLFKARKVIMHVGKGAGVGQGKGMKMFMLVFVMATLLIYLRTCFRLAETALGLDSYLFRNEHYFIALEFVPVLVAVFLFNAWHPGRCLGKNDGGAGRSSV